MPQWIGPLACGYRFRSRSCLRSRLPCSTQRLLRLARQADNPSRTEHRMHRHHGADELVFDPAGARLEAQAVCSIHPDALDSRRADRLHQSALIYEVRG